MCVCVCLLECLRQHFLWPHFPDTRWEFLFPKNIEFCCKLIGDFLWGWFPDIGGITPLSRNGETRKDVPFPIVALSITRLDYWPFHAGLQRLNAPLRTTSEDRARILLIAHRFHWTESRVVGKWREEEENQSEKSQSSRNIEFLTRIRITDTTIGRYTIVKLKTPHTTNQKRKTKPIGNFHKILIMLIMANPFFAANRVKVTFKLNRKWRKRTRRL